MLSEKGKIVEMSDSYSDFKLTQIRTSSSIWTLNNACHIKNNDKIKMQIHFSFDDTFTRDGRHWYHQKFTVTSIKKNTRTPNILTNVLKQGSHWSWNCGSRRCRCCSHFYIENKKITTFYSMHFPSNEDGITRKVLKAFLFTSFHKLCNNLKVFYHNASQIVFPLLR